MKTHRLIIVVLISMLLFACNKEENSVQANIKVAETEFELLLDEYGLSDSDIKFDGYTLGIDTTLIFFNGRIKEKLFISAFNKIDKSNIFSWTDKTKIDTVVVVDEGYGVSSTNKIDQFRIIRPYKYNNDYVFILQGITHGSQYTYNQRLITSDLYFVSKQDYVKKESLTYPIGSLFYYSISSWYNDNVAISLKSDNGRKHFFYSIKGQEIFEFQNDFSLFDVGLSTDADKNYIPVSLYDYITFNDTFSGNFGTIRGNFKCINIKTREVLWESEMPFSDLPEDTRLDMINFSQEEPNYVICNFELTLFSGEKISRKIKVVINTGQFEEV